MPNLGDIVYGYEIGKKDRRHKFVWLECPECHNHRWKAQKDIREKGICFECFRKLKYSNNWKGGKSKSSQHYVTVYLKPDDKFHPMASTNNYVLEHRLIMAKHLGRCLKSSEIVHHLNAIKTDNRIENLALTTFKAHPYVTFISQLQKRIRELEQLHLGI
uniref:Putative homing endonuclease n=1 Tax=viral metagenome TaxID=1070528 RepID=A0A6M3IYK1_9ZZZZ